MFSFLLGAFIGLVVAAVHYVIYDLLWLHLKTSCESYTWAFLLPFLGIFAASMIVRRFAVNPEIHSTEEVLQAYNQQSGIMRLAAFPAKVTASILTIGFGGSAGMEGPSVYIGASIASGLRRVSRRFGFEEEDAPLMVLAGASAGIAAIFKAPLTGIVFGLEVPYKDDLAHNAFIPSLIASVTSYMVFVSFAGVAPLFKPPHVYAVDYSDLIFSVLLGLVCGLLARMFVLFFDWSNGFLRARTRSHIHRALAGSAIVGLVGVLSIATFGAPYALGTGYEAVNAILVGDILIWQLLALFALKVVATSATMGAGGVGGIFIPMIMMGATIGGAFGALTPSPRALYPVLGMAAFLSAGYNTPLAAATFVAETTGSPGFIIPGLLAAAVSFTISGRRSVSQHQRHHRQTILHKRLEQRVSEVMTSEVVTVPATATIDALIHDYVLKYRHKSFPVVNDDRLYGMVALSDIKKVPTQEWPDTLVASVAATDIMTTYPNQCLAEVSDIMGELDIDRIPVVDPDNPTRMVGIISSSDIIRLEELTNLVGM